MAKLSLKDLIDQTADKTGETKCATETVLKAAFDTINETVNAGDEVGIYNFGTFKLKETAERKGRNPQTGEEITIAAKKTITFKATKRKQT